MPKLKQKKANWAPRETRTVDQQLRHTQGLLSEYREEFGPSIRLDECFALVEHWLTNKDPSQTIPFERAHDSYELTGKMERAAVAISKEKNATESAIRKAAKLCEIRTELLDCLILK